MAEHDQDDESSADRRKGERHFTCYPIHIQRGEGGETAEVEIALIQDLSASGALLLVREEVPPGARVKLHLDVFGDEGRVRVATGRVVRGEDRPAEQSDVWPFSAAVRFDEVQADLEPAIRELERAALEPR